MMQCLFCGVWFHTFEELSDHVKHHHNNHSDDGLSAEEIPLGKDGGE